MVVRVECKRGITPLLSGSLNRQRLADVKLNSSGGGSYLEQQLRAARPTVRYPGTHEGNTYSPGVQAF